MILFQINMWSPDRRLPYLSKTCCKVLIELWWQLLHRQNALWKQSPETKLHITLIFLRHHRAFFPEINRGILLEEIKICITFSITLLTSLFLFLYSSHVLGKTERADIRFWNNYPPLEKQKASSQEYNLTVDHLFFLWPAKQNILIVHFCLNKRPASNISRLQPCGQSPKWRLTCAGAVLPHEVVVLTGDGGALEVAVRVVQERLAADLRLLLLQLAWRRIQLFLCHLSNNSHVMTHVNTRRGDV